ncbi:E3 ubiquitin-protein ligase pub1 [Coemansia sp. RSA 2611]|nr:E3 ubiquitin-protein ligase pub1 [Coemansia sp. RSA 2611]
MEATANSSVGNGVYAPGQQQQQQPGQYGAGAQERALDEANARTLYVGNLDPLVTEAVLLKVFKPVSPVMDIKIITNKRLGGLNYAFIEFLGHDHATAALQHLNGRRIFENEIRINWAYTSAGQQVQEDTNSHFHIFVGDLSAEVNDQVLAKAFSVFPTVSDARVMWDMTSGKSRGYGFVAFRDRADAEKAIGQMNGEWLGSRAIRVNWANQKAATNKFSKHDSSASSTSINHQVGQPLSYEAVRDQTAQYNTTVYVGNLTNYTSQEQLQALFQPYGFVMELRMQPDRGFAFIKMDTHENAAMAITQLNGTPVNGRPVKCSWGKDRVADPKAAFGALAAAASNPAYSYPYVYGMPPPGQQYAVPPGATGQQPGQQLGQQQQQPANPQQWNGFGYDNYAYYANPNYAQQHAQMMADPAVPGTMPAAGAHGSSPDYNGGY